MKVIHMYVHTVVLFTLLGYIKVYHMTSLVLCYCVQNLCICLLIGIIISKTNKLIYLNTQKPGTENVLLLIVLLITLSRLSVV